MELHVCLWNDVDAFNFSALDLIPVQKFFPDLVIRHHPDAASFLAEAESAQLVVTWEFPVNWYSLCPQLRYVMTPAAGTDWVDADPTGEVSIIHGGFHAQILAESLLSALLYMNHQMPRMVDNFRTRQWDRNLQTKSRLLSGQTVLIIGLGRIGQGCAKMVAATGANVIGVRQSSSEDNHGIETYREDALPRLLPLADHVVLLLPGRPETDRYLSSERLRLCKPGALIYNFGRGNALSSEDLINAWEHIGGAFLDVVDEEPLPATSPLWQLDNIMITPHSSCIYADYRRLYVEELIDKLGPLTSA